MMTTRVRTRDLLLPLLLSLTPALASADALRLTAEGDAQDFGFSLSSAGDVNGDGRGDVIIGAPSYDGIEDFAGRAYVFFGPFTGDRSAADADASISAVNFGDNLGFSVAAAGDTNGDGFDDILVGARSNDARGIQAGQAYLFRGPVHGDLRVQDAVATFSGDEFDEVGRAVAGGDLNGDGIGDIIVGGPLANGDVFSSGQAFAWYGPVSGAHTPADADAVINGIEFNELLGTSLAAADLDGDGIDDLVVGAPRPNLSGAGTGTAYVFYGPVTGSRSASSADATITGEHLNDEFGSSVAAGDVDGDGIADLFVGASQFSAGRSGKAYLFHGPLTGFVSAASADAILDGEAAGDLYGDAVAIAGDVDGDGFGDFLVGGEFSDTIGPHAGRAFLYRGPLSGAVSAERADAVFTGATGNALGIHVAAAGDLDADGRADLLLGASGGDAAGFAQVLFGADLLPPALRVSVSAASGGPIVLPPAGGSFDFRVVVRNTSGRSVTVDFWTSLLTPPARSALTPVLGPTSFALAPGETLRRTFTQTIPQSFPAGRSFLVANVRNADDTVGDIANLPFRKRTAASD